MSDYANLIRRLRLQDDAMDFSLEDDAADAIEALIAERDALKVDAERYRWLKQASKAQYLWARGAFGLDDAAIDAAREKRDE